MKHQVVRTLLQASFLVVVAAVAGVGSARGQSLSTHVRINIPFDFTVADKKFPAGEYSIGRALSGSGDTLLQVSSVKENRTTFGLTYGVVTFAPKESDTLTFHQYGDQYCLSEVWPAGGSVGRTFRESRGEREARADLAKNKVATQKRTVSVTRGQ